MAPFIIFNGSSPRGYTLSRWDWGKDSVWGRMEVKIAAACGVGPSNFTLHWGPCETTYLFCRLHCTVYCAVFIDVLCFKFLWEAWWGLKSFKPFRWLVMNSTDLKIFKLNKKINHTCCPITPIYPMETCSTCCIRHCGGGGAGTVGL